MWIAEKDDAIVVPPIQNGVAAINCNTTVQVLDLTSLPGSQVKTGDPQSQNPVGHYIRITATSGDIYFLTGNNFNNLLNASPSSYSTLNATTGKVTLTNNEMDQIGQSGFKDFIVMPGGSVTTSTPPGGGSPCRYVALCTLSGTAVARIYQSGP